MANIIFNHQNLVEVPTLILQNRNFDTLGIIADASNLTYKENFNSPNELSFTIYKNINGKKNPLWSSIVDFKLLYVPEFKERFEISVSTLQEGTISKSITATSLCEAELGQITIRNVEINTEHDILNPSYDVNFPTIFFRDPEDFISYDWSDSRYADYSDDKKKDTVRHASLLHRLLNKASHYSIGYVADSLKSIQREFSISETDIYGELTGEIAEEFSCLFLFDSMTRTISAYDLYNTCSFCEYRGDFTDRCPECGGSDFNGQYGKDTTIFINHENLAAQISLETNSTSLKNCFYIEGGDDTITSAIRSINPNGSSYIYYFSEDTKKDMPPELAAKIDTYNETFEEYATSKEIDISNNNINTSAIDNYNATVKYIKQKFPKTDFSELESILNGYSSIIFAIYESIDLYQFLKTSMMPDIDTDSMGIDDSLNNIVHGFSTFPNFPNEIAIRNPTTATATTVENAILKTAKLYYNTGLYNLKIIKSSYVKASQTVKGSYIGKFEITSKTEKDDMGQKLTKESPTITIRISDNIALFTEQEIYRATASKDKIKDKQITSLTMDLLIFCERIELYSLDELENLSEMFRSCLDIIENLDLKDNESYEELYSKYSNFYNERIVCVSYAITKIDEYLRYVKELYFYDSAAYITNGILYEIKNDIQKKLDFEKYIGEDLYKTFCAYRREDKYSNSNYISDGLSNADVIKNTDKLMDVAKKELYKAGNLQYTLSTTMNNLLCLKEFQPLKDSFSVGNWIRVGIDDNIYKLRLLSYQVNFDDMQSIDVEFSTVEKIYSGISDIKSVIASASSIASSYDSLVQQADNASSAVNHVNTWIRDGLKATETKFVNADNQNLVIDEHGLLARSHDSIYDAYSPYQLKIVNNGLYTTSDNWEHIDTGIGRISYVNPETGDMVQDYGIIAKAVVGKLFLGENLGIYNENGSLKFNGDGLTIANGNSSVSINPNADRMFLIKSNGTDCLYIDSNGNLCLVGEIFKGTIDEGIINNGTINNGNGTFIVDREGHVDCKKLTATGANISGSVIEGAAITNSTLTGNTITSESFHLTKDGSITATSGNLSGDIKIHGALYGNASLNLYSDTNNIEFEAIRWKQSDIEPDSIEFCDPLGSPYIIWKKENGTHIIGTTYLYSTPVVTLNENLMSDIKELNIADSANFIYSLTPYQFKYKDNTSIENHHGFLSTELKDSMENNTWDLCVASQDGNTGLRETELISDIVATLKYQKQLIDELRAEIDTLKNKSQEDLT